MTYGDAGQRQMTEADVTKRQKVCVKGPRKPNSLC